MIFDKSMVGQGKYSRKQSIYLSVYPTQYKKATRSLPDPEHELLNRYARIILILACAVCISI